MLRITATNNGHQYVLLRLEGRVAGPWVAELWKSCEKVLGDGKALVLNLADVSFLDSAGVKLLATIHARGAELADCSPFVEQQLRTAE